MKDIGCAAAVIALVVSGLIGAALAFVVAFGLLFGPPTCDSKFPSQPHRWDVWANQCMVEVNGLWTPEKNYRVVE